MNDNVHPVMAAALRPLIEQTPLAAEIDRLRSEIRSADEYADKILDKHNAVIAAYDRALQDPQFKAPTYLHAAIELMR